MFQGSLRRHDDVLRAEYRFYAIRKKRCHEVMGRDPVAALFVRKYRGAPCKCCSVSLYVDVCGVCLYANLIRALRMTNRFAMHDVWRT